MYFKIYNYIQCIYNISNWLWGEFDSLWWVTVCNNETVCNKLLHTVRMARLCTKYFCYTASPFAVSFVTKCYILSCKWQRYVAIATYRSRATPVLWHWEEIKYSPTDSIKFCIYICGYRVHFCLLINMSFCLLSFYILGQLFYAPRNNFGETYCRRCALPS
jgi:hypothetical protein